MSTVYITWFLLGSFSLTLIFYYMFALLDIHLFYNLFVDFASSVFSMICFTASNAVVLQNILKLFHFSSFTTNGSPLQVLIFFLTATSSFILNLAVLAIIFLLSSSLSSEFRLTSSLFTISLFLFVLTIWALFFLISVFCSFSVFTCLLFLPLVIYLYF